jgi:peptidoglycan hydrolase-like protein with peptidoglycan-binding domain
MKRLLVTTILLCGAFASAFADESVRTAEAKLKEGGFYFGPTDGVISSDFSAGVTRYQIRNGLQITGNLNEETSKALGVKPEVTPRSAAAPDAETWRRLRKSDQQFLTRAAASSPLPAARSESPTKALEPVASDSSRVVLSPERLRDYVAAFVLAGLDPQIGAELEFFGDRVDYYDDGAVGRERVRADLQRYAREWPQRRFWLAGDVEVEPQPDSRLRVTFPLRYELANGAKQRSGKVRKTLLLEVRGADLQIVSVNERKA